MSLQWPERYAKLHETENGYRVKGLAHYVRELTLLFSS